MLGWYNKNEIYKQADIIIIIINFKVSKLSYYELILGCEDT